MVRPLYVLAGGLSTIGCRADIRQGERMSRAIVTGGLIVILGIATSEVRVNGVQEPSIGEPARLIQTVLERMTREPPAYRGDGGTRLKWEWWDGIWRSYLFEKHQLLEEVTAGLPNEPRDEWVYRNVKVTFQDVFRMPPQSDDKLAPILSYYVLLNQAPSATFEGLALYGKDGELKGTITRKYTVSTADYPMTWSNAGTMARSRYLFVEALEYKDAKSGKVDIAAGNSSDAFNLKWGDIKDRVVDDMSESMATERRTRLRAAFAKGLKESIPER
jgi:hypothetical protein